MSDKSYGSIRKLIEVMHDYHCALNPTDEKVDSIMDEIIRIYGRRITQRAESSLFEAEMTYGENAYRIVSQYPAEDELDNGVATYIDDDGNEVKIDFEAHELETFIYDKL